MTEPSLWKFLFSDESIISLYCVKYLLNNSSEKDKYSLIKWIKQDPIFSFYMYYGWNYKEFENCFEEITNQIPNDFSKINMIKKGTMDGNIDESCVFHKVLFTVNFYDNDYKVEGVMEFEKVYEKNHYKYKLVECKTIKGNIHCIYKEEND